MSNTQKMHEYDCNSNHEIIRELTAEEKESIAAFNESTQNNALAVENARNEILNRLGITADEARLLLA